MTWEQYAITRLAAASSEALPLLAIAWSAGVQDGRDEVLAALGRAGHDVARAAAPIMKWPRWDELQGRREPDYRPCSVRCQKCSRCIASLSYWERGGRPFLGLEQEAEPSRAGAA